MDDKSLQIRGPLLDCDLEGGTKKAPPPAPKSRCNCVGCIQRSFNYLYPKNQWMCETPQANNLQHRFGWIVIMHLMLAIASLAFIGFISMLTDVTLMIIAYSVYLAPRNYTAFVYFLMLIVGILSEIYDAFRSDLQKSGSQKAGKVVTAVIYGVTFFYTGQRWWQFFGVGTGELFQPYEKRYSKGRISDVDPFDGDDEWLTTVVKRVKAQGGMYTDHYFPPDQSSLIDNDVTEDRASFEGIEWKRAADIGVLNDDEGQLQVFKGGIEPGDVKQGSVGNCYFLSAIAVMAERPDRIKEMFVTQTQNFEGIWCLILYKNGICYEVVMDDFIPCKHGQPCFTRAHGNELWAIMLEKAWSKVHGSYERTAAGFPHLAMRDMTGAPSYSIVITDELEKDLIEWDKKDYMMCASVHKSGQGMEEVNDTGIVNQHAYGLIAVRKLQKPPVTLVQLRNPWGNKEWNGAWSDKDEENWTPELKKLLGYSDKDDGIFWMDFKDFMAEYKRVQVCKFNKDYSYSFRKSPDGSYILFRVVVKYSGPMTISLNQIDKRCYNKTKAENYSYSVVKLKLIKQEGDKKKIVQEIYEAPNRDAHMEINDGSGGLTYGTYLLFAEVQWENNDPKQYTVSCYGENFMHWDKDMKDEIPLEELPS